jgi:hypothetical protein
VLRRIRPASKARFGRRDRVETTGPQKIVERPFDPRCQDVEVAHRVVVTEDAEADVAVVRQRGDRDALVRRERRLREEFQEAASEEVQGHRRPRDVRDEQVEGTHDRLCSGHRGDRGRRQVARQVRDRLAGGDVPRALRPLHRGVNAIEPHQRRPVGDRKIDDHHRHPVAQAVVFAADRHRDHHLDVSRIVSPP